MAVEDQRPSIADMLSGCDSQATMSQVSSSVTTIYCPNGSSMNTDTDRSITPVSATDQSEHAKTSDTSCYDSRRRALSQLLPQQSDVGSMMSLLNCSSPQLSRVDCVEMYASQDGLSRTCKEKGSSRSSTSSHRRSPRDDDSTVCGSETKNTIVDSSSCASTASKEQSRRDEEERRMCEFKKIEGDLKALLSVVDQQLDAFQAAANWADLQAVHNITCQFSVIEQQLVQLTVTAGEVMELSDSVEVVKAVQDKVARVTEQVAGTRKELGVLQAKAETACEELNSNKTEMSQLTDWLSDASRRLSECTDRPSVSTVAAEQQLGQLLTIVHEFTARKGRFQDLKELGGLDQNSVDELCRQFERANDACRVSLDRHRSMFGSLTDIRNQIQQIASWVANTGPIYSLDSGSAVGNVDVMDETHAELERRLEETSQLRGKAVEFLASLRSTGEGREQGFESIQENETSLIQPVLECHSQLHQLRELVARRAASVVSYVSQTSCIYPSHSVDLTNEPPLPPV